MGQTSEVDKKGLSSTEEKKLSAAGWGEKHPSQKKHHFPERQGEKEQKLSEKRSKLKEKENHHRFFSTSFSNNHSLTKKNRRSSFLTRFVASELRQKFIHLCFQIFSVSGSGFNQDKLMRE